MSDSGSRPSKRLKNGLKPQILTSEGDYLAEESSHSMENRSRQNQNIKRTDDILQEFFKELKECGFNQKLSSMTRSHEFKQQWQKKQKEKSKINFSYYFRQQQWYMVLNIILLLLQITLLWNLSVFRIFENRETNMVFVFCLTVQILDVVLKISYVFLSVQKGLNFSKQSLEIKQMAQYFASNFYCLIFGFVGLVSEFSNPSYKWLFVFDFVALVLIYNRLEQIFSDLKATKYGQEKKSYVSLVSLMSTLILIIHCFAILMFFISSFSQKNYLQVIDGIEQMNWNEKYIYSFYFSGTTILTVGYGDILPKNLLQIFIVLIMQVFGVVMIVYLNGEVGNVLCKLRRQKQNLENDISILERITYNFRLSMDTSQKIREFLINNRRVDEEKQIQEEQGLMTKINEELRQEATLTNHFNVLKQSLFITMNFSKKAQLQLANKMIRNIYSPNENISQIYSKEKMSLLSKGQICLYIGHKKGKDLGQARKIIKILKKKNHNDQGDNCFGFVSCVTGVANNLHAFAKDFSICYGIERKDFIEAVSCDNLDFEKYHEIQTSYLTCPKPQRKEVEDYHSSKEHFEPEFSQVLSDYKNCKSKRRRRQYLRTRPKSKMIFSRDQNEAGSDDDSLVSSSQSESSVSIRNVEIEFPNDYNTCLSLTERGEKYNSQNHLQQNFNKIIPRSYKRRFCNKVYARLKEDKNQISQKNLQISEPFDLSCEYQNYYMGWNLTFIMRKVNYHTNVLEFFTNLFEGYVPDPNKNNSQKIQSDITKMRRQKDIIKSLNC